jgi:pimeloyl-ACP methyl ester carboxylesterase
MSTLRGIPILVLVFLVAATGAAQQISPRVVTLHAADGTVLKGSYFASEKPGPGILFLHQCNQQRKLWDVIGERLAASGINVLTFDYRGFGESEGTPHDKLTTEEETRLKPKFGPVISKWLFNTCWPSPG